MPAPFPQAAAAAGFTDYIKQYSGPVYALSCLLLEKGARAEQAAAATFAALYEPWAKGRIPADTGAADAYRECIRQCALLAPDRTRCTCALLSWEDITVSALWYGLQLPLPDICGILQCSLSELKIRLREIREQMAAAHAALPAVHRPSAG